jgi:hypothetical protein
MRNQVQDLEKPDASDSSSGDDMSEAGSQEGSDDDDSSDEPGRNVQTPAAAGMLCPPVLRMPAPLG